MVVVVVVVVLDLMMMMTRGRRNAMRGHFGMVCFDNIGQRKSRIGAINAMIDHHAFMLLLLFGMPRCSR